jgi:O-antigen/teichoic acid export membrane protein
MARMLLLSFVAPPGMLWSQASGRAPPTRMSTEPHLARHRLDLVVLRGFLWTSGGRLLIQTATWVVSIFIARLLTPRDYGIAAMASLYVGFAQLLAELGFGAAIVQRSDLTRQTIASIMGLSAVMGVLLAIISIPVGFGLAAFNREPVLVAVVAVYGLNFIPAAIRSVANALLSRQMAFQKITALGLIETATASLTSLVLALNGWSVWSLVLGNTAAVCIAALLSVAWAHPGFSLNLRALRGTGVLSFSYKMLVSRTAWYMYASTDFLIIGRRLGAQAMGHYSLAYQFASIPAERITGALTQVLFPVFSTLQNNRAELARYFKYSTEACSLTLMPIYVGLALVSRDLIAVALGPKWGDAALILTFLCVAAAIRSIATVANTVIVSCGNAGFPARISLIGLVILPPIFFVASYWGAAAVAAVWVVVYPPLLAVPTIVMGLRAVNLSLSDLWLTLKPAVSATSLMAIVVYALGLTLADMSATMRLPLLVFAGAATYAAVLLLGWRDRISRYVGLATRGLKPASGAPVAQPGTL